MIGTDRIERLLKLIQALQASRPRTLDELTEVLDVSRRTVFRDLKLLSRAGISYRHDRATGRYSTESTSLLPPVNLSLAETLVLMLATRHLLHRYVPDQATAAEACMKIENALPPAMRDYCGSLVEQIEIRPEPASDTAAIIGAFAAFQTALAKRVKVQVRYDSYYEGRVIDVVLRPYRLAYIHRGWYVIAHSERDKEVRTFKVERTLQIKLLGATYSIDRRFNLDDYFGCAWNMIRGARRYHVKIRFQKKVAGNVDEIAWHKTQTTSYADDGSLVFEVDVDGLNEIAWWILGYGDQAQVLEPPELRQIIVGYVRRMGAYYERNGRGRTMPETSS